MTTVQDMKRNRDDKLRDTERKARHAARSQYLRKTKAVPTPTVVMAIWVEVAERQGNKFRVLESDFAQGFSVDERNNTFPNVTGEAVSHDYDSLGWKAWTPTMGNVSIPEGYGSGRLDIMVLSDVVNQPLHATSGDHRENWAWGHSTVRTLTRDENGEFVAGIHGMKTFDTYRDIEELRANHTLDELISLAHMILAPKAKPLSTGSLALDAALASING